MDRIFIKPSAREIVIKGQNQEGRGDIFSYTYENGDEKRILGNLYIVGNINGVEKEPDENVSYVTNLVASLAKREYYTDPAAAPRDAFNSCLRKINDVVGEFFQNKDTKINIGIFAIAGEQIYISKIGKFKIFLARANKNIDILNNIELFQKDHVEEEKFSNIISGKICAGDRLFAFYPCRSLIARERFIKAQLIKSDPEKFVEHLHSIKKDKENFGCTALYLDLKEVKEPAIAPKPRQQKLKESVPEEILPVPAIEEMVTLAALTSTSAISSVPNGSPQTASTAEKTAINKAVVSKRIVADLNPVTKSIEPPKIIPAEFSLGRRKNPIFGFLKKIDLGHIYRLSLANPQKKLLSLIILVGIIGVIIGLTLTVKSVLVVSPEEKQISQAIKDAETNLKVAETKAVENDLNGARNLLAASLGVLSDTDDKKVDDIRAQLISALDKIDIAEETLPALIATLPVDLGNPVLVAPSFAEALTGTPEGTQTNTGINVFYKTTDTKGYLAKIENNSVSAKIEIKDFNPWHIFNTEKGFLLTDLNGKKLAVANFSKETAPVKSFEFNGASTDKAIAADIYESNLYILGPETIYKISDAANGATQAKSWSREKISPAALIAVDGKIFTLSETGELTVYYKGKKESQFSTAIAATPSTGSINSPQANSGQTDSSQLLTTKDSPNLYMLNKKLGRIYVLKKDSGALAKTVKIGNSQPIVNASIAPNGAIYILTSDFKIWKIIP